MSEVAPAWVVRKSSIDYTVTASGSHVVLRANRESEATMIFDNTDRSLDNTFFEEDEVDIYFGAISTANHMMVGYIDGLEYSQTSSGRKLIKLHITDWGSYLAGKTVFENEFQRTKTVNEVITTASAEISGLGLNLGALTDTMKQPFRGTYVKDAWRTAVEVGKADYFVDETKTLQAFEENSRDVNFGSGKISVVDDGTPSNLIVVVDHKFPYSFNKSALERYRTVTATNGIFETFPIAGAGTFERSKYKLDVIGKTFSGSYIFGSQFDYEVQLNQEQPVEFFSAKDIGGGYTLDTVRLNVHDSTTNINTVIGQLNPADNGEDITISDMQLFPTDWQNITFFIQRSLSQGSTVELRMDENTGGGNYWTRDITADINGSAFTYLSYPMPANTTDTVSNGWTKVGTPVLVNNVQVRFGTPTGYALGDFLEFALFNFSRRRRATVTGAGTPATEKILIDSTAKSIQSLTTLAIEEQARTDRTHNTGGFTIDGDVKWKEPAYIFSIDFTNSLGNGTQTADARSDEIRHTLENGVHKTTINFKPSFARP